MSWPSIDHGIISPSGRVSKRTHARTLARVYKELFPNGLPAPQCPQIDERARLLQVAADLEAMADRGFKPRVHRKEAARLRAEANKEESND